MAIQNVIAISLSSACMLTCMKLHILTEILTYIDVISIPCNTSEELVGISAPDPKALEIAAY